METNYFTVRAVLRTDKIKKDGTCPIYIVLQRNGLTQKLSLSESIEEKYWDKKAEQAKGKGFGALNAIIKREKQNLEDFIRENKSLGNSLSCIDISNFWNGKSNTQLDFYNFFDFYCKRHFSKIQQSTQIHYITLEKKLKAFSPKLIFTEIDYSFMVRFEHFLIESKSGVYNMTKFFKSILKEATKQRLITDNSWMNYKVQRPNERKIHLTSEELELFKNCDISKHPHLKVTKDMFLFSCYVGGMRFSDVSRITKENYKDEMINIIQKKTGEILLTPVQTEAKKIICKYWTKYKETESIFPALSNQKTNKNLKKLAELSGIKKQLTFHASRHTFGTIMAQENVNAFQISKMMGHKKLDQTFSYTDISASSMKEIMKGIKFTKVRKKNPVK